MAPLSPAAASKEDQVLEREIPARSNVSHDRTQHKEQ